MEVVSKKASRLAHEFSAHVHPSWGVNEKTRAYILGEALDWRGQLFRKKPDSKSDSEGVLIYQLKDKEGITQIEVPHETAQELMTYALRMGCDPR